jgi:serine/threonine protein kinase
VRDVELTTTRTTPLKTTQITCTQLSFTGFRRSQFVDGDFEEIEREMAMLYRLKHPGLAAFYGICCHESVLMLIQEFCPASLEDFVQKQPGGGGLWGSPTEFFRLAVDIAETLCFLHDRKRGPPGP